MTTIVKNRPFFISNLFDDLLENIPTHSKLNKFSTAVNIYELSDGFKIELNAPGRNKEDFKINIEKGLLIVTYENKKAEEKIDFKTIRKEYSFENFKKSFNLEDNINTDNISAKYENGILSILLLKKNEIRTSAKEINIL